jgi:hypothetical protein
MKFFAHKLGVVEATMVYAPTNEYFFAKNGDPRQIRCHRNQGGRLRFIDGHLIVTGQDAVELPEINARVALIRRSNWPGASEFTQAAMWVPIEDWQAHKWAVNLNETYRAIAYDHRVNGESNNSTEVVLIEGTLNQIILREHRQKNDPLTDGHKSEIGSLVFTYSVRWERWAKDMWAECRDPRPPVY